MKKFLLILSLGLFLGCSNQQESTKNTAKLEKLIEQQGEKISDIPQTLLDDAQILITRSEIYGYKLITIKTLKTMEQTKQIVLIDTSPKGQYLLKHLKGAKHFEFNHTFLSPSGELLLDSKTQKDFKSKMGDNPLALLVFYDQSNTPAYKISPSEIASMWSKKMGYHNVYYLVGDMHSWEAQGYKTTNEIPKCCQ